MFVRVPAGSATQHADDELIAFADLAAHDLRAPLAVVSGFVELLSRRYADQLDDRGHEIIAGARLGTLRLQAMIDGLHEWACAGRAQVDVTDVDVRALVEELKEDLAGAIGATGAVVQAPGLPVLRAHRASLAQLLRHLITNAVTYVAPGVQPVVEVGGDVTREGWSLWVRDNGVGVPAEQREAVFEPFTRLEGRGEGVAAGMGLAVCERLARCWGGHIRVEDVAGEGSRFVIWVPRQAVAVP